jgi:hypothetical protein
MGVVSGRRSRWATQCEKDGLQMPEKPVQILFRMIEWVPMVVH